jgi:hypothetical protein
MCWERCSRLYQHSQVVYDGNFWCSDCVLDFFSEVYEEHLLLFQQLFPTLPIKAKQHY